MLPIHRDPQFKEPTDHFLSEGAYLEVLDKMVIACTDVVIVTRSPRRVVLAPRTARPAPGLWMLGGRLEHGKSIEESVQRHFKRDTGFEIDPKRLSYLNTFQYMFADRQQEPRTNGTHTLGITFAFEPTEDELDLLLSVQLPNIKEYRGHLQALSPEEVCRMMATGEIHPAFGNVLNTLFPV